MRRPKHPESSSDVEAANWLAKRDRGLSPSEQDDYLQWLQRISENGNSLRRMQRAWWRLDILTDWLPRSGSRPNPDLLAVTHRRRRWPTFAMAAAAVVAAGLGAFYGRNFFANGVRLHDRPNPERMIFEDGSMAELNTGARVETRFTADRREVHLLNGEAHFVVAKNPARPFVVSTGEYEVRATGTAFDVKCRPLGVSVLVTEGRVQLGDVITRAGAPVAVSAGQLAEVKSMTADHPSVEIRDLSPGEEDTLLAWQGLKLDFTEIPLKDAITEFNRCNSRKLAVADAETGNIQIGGTFRADNLDAFVRLLNVGFGVTARSEDNRIVLQRPQK